MKEKEHQIERYSPTIDKGLSSIQVQKRFKDNLSNSQDITKTKSIPQIILGNALTLFNLINLILALALFWAGSYKNTLFMVVVISNLIISTVQEIRAKITADRLSLISAVKSIVIRDGMEKHIPIDEIVLDDILKLQTGNQVTADCTILHGTCEVNESFITGEADAIEKHQGDTLLSGSYIVSGSVYAQAEKISKYTYISSISKDAKKLNKNNSEIMNSINKIIKCVSIAIFPIGTILLYGQYRLTGNLKEAVIQATAGLIGMIPEGLVLLTSMVFAVSVIRLSKHNVLAQELSSVESLARVDTLCLDKTGTLTTGKMSVEKIIQTDKNFNSSVINGVLSSMVENGLNETSKAIKEHLSNCKRYDIIHEIPFSSVRKFSACEISKLGSFVLGAYEYTLKDDEHKSTIEKYSENYRVLTLSYSRYHIRDNTLPPQLSLVAIILLKDNLRPNAKETIEYFKSQDVDVKIISGDSVKTVCNVAKNVGLDSIHALDTSKVTNKELIQLVDSYNIFCRVTPENKKLIVKSLKDKGHTVAMTGDGVNDVPALKEADCSIALSNGAEATRNVSQLMLLNSDFSSLPKVVAEGRRSINNIKRSASLFLIKTIYSILLDLIFTILTLNFPFVPIQLTLISAICIGIPSFTLALEPNNKRVSGKFLRYVLQKAIPTALDIVLTVTLISILGDSVFIKLSQEEISTICVIATAFIGLIHLFRLCQPFNTMRKILFIGMCIIFIGGITLFNELFSIVRISKVGYILMASIMILSIILFYVFHIIVKNLKTRLER
ncbi:MAG: HAD-IC family P-type ATPase [Oscillospiraceae bacterium]